MKILLDYFSPVKRAARKFKKQRADYYEYLADVLSDSDGRILLHGIFVKDSERYSVKSFLGQLFPHPRAILSEYWSKKFLDTGASVSETWRGTLPDSDMLIIASATEYGGNGALPNALREVARIVRVVSEAKSIFLSIVLAAIFAVVIVLATLSVIPLVAWPAIKESFDFIPISYYGPHAMAMENFTKSFPLYIGPIILAILLLAYIYKWSLKRWRGKSRQFADRFVIYRVYKTYRGAMFLSTLSTLAKRGSGLNLRESVEAISKEAEPWLQWYCDKILENLNLGIQDGRLFDVGLLEDDALYYLFDMAEAKELETGLKLTGSRTERDMGKIIKLRAFIIRWSILIGSLLMVAAILFNVLMAIRELNDAAKLIFL